jgi:coenzyme F420 hydrogenase subunit beta
MSDTWNYLLNEVIKPGLCTQCGSCVGLSQGKLEFKERRAIPTPQLATNDNELPQTCRLACPARHCSYPDLNKSTFGELPNNWLSGRVIKSRIGFSKSENIRRGSASGGAITSILLYLLESRKISGAICLKMGADVPYLAKPVIARTPEEIVACAQSVYSVSPVNTILSEIKENEGPLAYVGLPDQVASIRKLQKENHPSVKNIRYIIGPYVGTQMYFESIRSFLRSNGIKSEHEIVDLKYRAGEWPGKLRIELKNGRILQADKFHYNYLIPFYITSSSLQAVDFTNELTDISVGDAWSPKYEKERKGFSVILSRSEVGENILNNMINGGVLHGEEISIEEALDMHGHMIDFKKRGSFLRNKRKTVQPFYGYEPIEISWARKAVERILQIVFCVGGSNLARSAVEKIPLKIVGSCFDLMRKSWKNFSKPTKRKGLKTLKFKLYDER